MKGSNTAEASTDGVASIVAPVSVVIPCFNCAGRIEKAIASVMGQTVAPAEVILVEDGSSDGGATKVSILRLLERQEQTAGASPLRVIWMEKNCGPAAARNAGWDAATAEFVAFLDADDAWHPRKIEIQYDWMKRSPACDGSGHGTQFVRDFSSAMERPVHLSGTYGVQLWSMLFSNGLRTRTVMVRRKLNRRFPPALRYSEDYSLWLDLVADGHSMSILDVNLAFSFRPEFSAGGHSSQLWRMEVAELSIFLRLLRERRLPWAWWLMASAVSLLKYCRRLAVRSIR